MRAGPCDENGLPREGRPKADPCPRPRDRAATRRDLGGDGSKISRSPSPFVDSSLFRPLPDVPPYPTTPSAQDPPPPTVTIPVLTGRPSLPYHPFGPGPTSSTDPDFGGYDGDSDPRPLSAQDEGTCDATRPAPRGLRGRYKGSVVVASEKTSETPLDGESSQRRGGVSTGLCLRCPGGTCGGSLVLGLLSIQKSPRPTLDVFVWIETKKRNCRSRQ